MDRLFAFASTASHSAAPPEASAAPSAARLISFLRAPRSLALYAADESQQRYQLALARLKNVWRRRPRAAAGS